MFLLFLSHPPQTVDYRFTLSSSQTQIEMWLRHIRLYPLLVLLKKEKKLKKRINIHHRKKSTIMPFHGQRRTWPNLGINGSGDIVHPWWATRFGSLSLGFGSMGLQAVDQHHLGLYTKKAFCQTLPKPTFIKTFLLTRSQSDSYVSEKHWSKPPFSCYCCEAENLNTSPFANFLPAVYFSPMLSWIDRKTGMKGSPRWNLKLTLSTLFKVGHVIILFFFG